MHLVSVKMAYMSKKICAITHDLLNFSMTHPAWRTLNLMAYMLKDSDDLGDPLYLSLWAEMGHSACCCVACEGVCLARWLAVGLILEGVDE